MNANNLKTEMKKIKVGHVALLCTGVFLAFAIIGSILLVAGGGLNVIGDNGMLHNGIFFNVGPGTLTEVNDRKEMDMAGVTNIIIAGVSSEVTVLSGGDKAVAELKGQCKTTGTPVHLETSLNGGALTIQIKYPAMSGMDNTRLTVTIPAEYQGNLSISCVSGDIIGEALPFKLQQVNLNEVSGQIRFSTASYASLKAGTVSGDVNLAGISADTRVNTTSGEITLGYTLAAPATVSTVSGGVTITLPADAAFGVDFASVSGDFNSNHPAIMAHGTRGFQSIREGAPLIKVNTTSGDCKIEGN